jgi:hypothetical protein
MAMAGRACRHGTRHWGRFGAAGLLLRDERRGDPPAPAEWTHEGGAWGLPGGARDPTRTRCRPPCARRPRKPASRSTRPAHRLLHRRSRRVELHTVHIGPRAWVRSRRGADPESTEIRWWPRALVPRLPLHSGLAAQLPAWTHPRTTCTCSLTPPTWWAPVRMGGGATGPAPPPAPRQLAQLARDGIVAAELPTTRRSSPASCLAHRGRRSAARAATVPDGANRGLVAEPLDVVPAPGVGDDTMWPRRCGNPGTLVITADRGLLRAGCRIRPRPSGLLAVAPARNDLRPYLPTPRSAAHALGRAAMGATPYGTRPAIRLPAASGSRPTQRRRRAWKALSGAAGRDTHERPRGSGPAPVASAPAAPAT